jgi:hypothetical protein
MVRSIELPPCIFCLEEVAEFAGHKVLPEVDDNSLLIVGDPRGILDK